MSKVNEKDLAWQHIALLTETDSFEEVFESFSTTFELSLSEIAEMAASFAITPEIKKKQKEEFIEHAIYFLGFNPSYLSRKYTLNYFDEEEVTIEYWEKGDKIVWRDNKCEFIESVDRMGNRYYYVTYEVKGHFDKDGNSISFR